MFSTAFGYPRSADGGFVDPHQWRTTVSNFLLWQIAYAEFYFSDVLWPDFDEQEFNQAIFAYQQRDRRFGGAEQED